MAEDDKATQDPGPLGPEGSAYDAGTRRRPSRTPWRRLRGWVSVRSVALVAWVLPVLYYAYCWVVWKTSRRHDELNERIKVALAAHVGVVSCMWHEEVFPSAFAYGPLKGSALASTSTFGLLITRLLEFCGCDVYRGGSSRGVQRRRQVLPDMIRHMDQSSHCLYGLTVDGSHGPVYKMKSGGLVIARACHTPIYLGRTWFSNHVRLRSWDRSAIPLPFGRLHQIALGPYWVPPDTTDEELLKIRDHLELELLELAEHSVRQFEGPDAQPRRREGFPEDWAPRWPAGQVGLAYGPHDLKPDQPPQWARRRKPEEAVRVPPAEQ